MQSADLEDASMLGANLDGANLFDAAVPGTKFTGARFAARHRILIEFDDGGLVKSVERSEQK